MTIVAVAGDVCTTTAVALTSAWPSERDVVLVEADPSGGDLAAWLDMPVAPSLSTIVTRALDGAWPDIERHVRTAAAGIRVVPAPDRAGEAARAIGESARFVVATFAARSSPVVIADTGRLHPAPAAHAFVAAAEVTVLVHRQSVQSARAAAVRLQRLAEQVDTLANLPTALVVAVVGGAPFDLGEIGSFLYDAVGGTRLVGLPTDDLSAAVLGGRAGVTARRLSRLPLMRAAGELATVVDRLLRADAETAWSTTG
jgi:MinD-like ATPase involved in chromosome partitioning or flagellar assembly